ncbi:MAG TPA: hypothetical protein VIE91_06150 [Methylophilaceae bacterium]|jgi:hypothetical protein
MNRKIAIIIALQTLLIIIMFWLLVFYGKDEYENYTHEQDDEIESPSRVVSQQGATIISLTQQTQEQSGISTTVLKSSNHQGVLTSFGSVVSIDPLIELRTRYLASKAEANVARASLTTSQQEYQRLLKLNQDNRNISDRALLVAETSWKTDEAKVSAAELAATNLRDIMRQQWGEVLTIEATKTNPDKPMQQLLQNQSVLLQISLPFDVATPKTNSRLLVTPAASTAKPIEADFVSVSPQTDHTIQGKTYYYRATTGDFRSGMRISVVIPDSAKAVSGVVVPASAVVWYGGKAWVYRQQDAEHFIRQAINTDIAADNGWFNTNTIKPNDAVVTSGAQLLLSEEFKYQIKNENED